MENLNHNEALIQHVPSCLYGKIIEPSKIEDKTNTYNFDGNVFTGYGNKSTRNDVFTFHLPPNKKISDVKKIKIIGSDEPKVSWGSSDSWRGTNISDAIKDYVEKPVTDYASNATACNFTDIVHPIKVFEIMDKKIDKGAIMICKQRVTFSWFEDKNNHYIQIAYFQYGETWGATVGGGMWLYLGTQFEITFK